MDIFVRNSEVRLVAIISTAFMCFVLTNVVYSFPQLSNGDAEFDINKLIPQYGYPIQVHEITTDDGYLLTLQRIPYGRNNDSNTTNKYPVIVNHGLMGSAEHALIGGPEKGIAYMLADHGYDVWLINCRGTWHSRKHKRLDPDRDKEFWQFSIHEIGYYDLPNAIDYILSITGKEKLHFVGHSQGTTSFFIMCCSKPQYNDKISLMIAMAPSAILRNIKMPLFKLLAPMYPVLQKLANALNIHELLPRNIISNDDIRNASKQLCIDFARNDICSFLLHVVTMYSADQIDPATVPFIVASSPGGSSVHQALHYAQIITTGKFQQYDWGRKQNIKIYGSPEPKEYNLHNVVAPVVLIYGESDAIVTKEDVAILATILPNVVELYRVPYEKWTHLDFIWARDIVQLLNNHIIELMIQYNDS